MNLEEFTTQLKELATKASKSDDPTVLRSAGVLLGLSASITAGEAFFDAFADHVGIVVSNQRKVIGNMLGKKQG